MLTLLLVCAFSPRVHSIPRGPHERVFGFRQNAEKAQIASHNFAFEITLSQGNNAHSFARVRLFPTGTQYPAGSPDPKKLEFYKYYSLKRREFDEIVVFSAGFENSSVLRRTRIFKFRRKSKISRIIAVLRRACEQPKPHPASISASKRGLPSHCLRFPLPLQKSRASYRLPLPRFRDFRSRSAQT